MSLLTKIKEAIDANVFVTHDIEKGDVVGGTYQAAAAITAFVAMVVDDEAEEPKAPKPKPAAKPKAHK